MEITDSWYVPVTVLPASVKSLNLFPHVCLQQNVCTPNVEVLFIGDFNMDMLSGKDNRQGPSQELSGFCDQLCLTVIRNPTRVTNSSKSLLDVMLVSHPERYETSGNLHLGISDHDLVYTVKKQKLPKPKVRTIEFRSLQNLDNEAFISDLKSIPWDSSYIFDDVDDVWTHWEKLYKQVLDKHAPVQQIRLRDNQLPWVNPSIQKQIRLRNRLYKKFRRAPTDANWVNYKNQRNIVTAIKRNAVKEICLDAASCSSKSSIRSFWKKLKPYCRTINPASMVILCALLKTEKLLQIQA